MQKCSVDCIAAEILQHIPITGIVLYANSAVSKGLPEGGMKHATFMLRCGNFIDAILIGMDMALRGIRIIYYIF